MKDSVIEIRDGEINVEEIMKKIRENIRIRKEAESYPNIPGGNSLPITPCNEVNASRPIDDITGDLSFLRNNWDIQNNSYFISSSRPYLGKYLVKGRELVHGEVRRYVDPVVWKQVSFNQKTSQTLFQITQKFESLEERTNENSSNLNNVTQKFESLEERTNENSSNLNNMSRRIDEIENRLMNITDEIESSLQSFINSIAVDIENKAWLANLLEKRLNEELKRDLTKSNKHLADDGLNYFVFEDKFRGSRKDVKRRQTLFLQYFEGCSKVLDIGSGRGEFLELMQENSVGASGVDIDTTMVDYCRSRGFSVELMDALTYLEGLDDASLDGIFIDQVVEHLEPSFLVRLLALCHKKLKYGFYLVAETVNPLSFFSFANFYIDMSHVRPVHPETLRFLFDNAGFRELEVNFHSPVTEDARLQKMPEGEEKDEMEQQRIGVYNRNIEMLNGTLYGEQDYSVIGKK